MDQLHRASVGRKAVDLAKLVRDCQVRVSTAYVAHGDAGALAALACGSIWLNGFIAAGVLVPNVIDKLAETADNLGVTTRLGQDVVDIALDTGPELYEALADACQRRALEVAA